MNSREQKRHIASEALILLGMLALLTGICRLWPILLLMILGIFAAALRLLFYSANRVEIMEPRPLLLPEPKSEPTEEDVRKLAYSVILRRITELVVQQYPEVRWVWEAPNAMQEMKKGADVYILLNRTGGYRKAKVIYWNWQVIKIEYHPENKATLVEETKENYYEKEPIAPIVEESEETFYEEESIAENYELLAFEWCEAHMLELNERCNEAMGQGQNEVLIPLEELPVPESWSDICKELGRAGLEHVECVIDGILIIL